MGYKLPNRTGAGPVIMLARRGTRLRPRWQIILRHNRGGIPTTKYLEDLGYYEAFTNARGKRYLRLKTERCKYWIGNGVRITRGAYHLLEVAGILPPAPVKRKITVGEVKLARHLHEKLKAKGALRGLPYFDEHTGESLGIPAFYTDVAPGTMELDRWTKSAIDYQYYGKL